MRGKLGKQGLLAIGVAAAAGIGAAMFVVLSGGHSESKERMMEASLSDEAGVRLGADTQFGSRSGVSAADVPVHVPWRDALRMAYATGLGVSMPPLSPEESNKFTDAKSRFAEQGSFAVGMTRDVPLVEQDQDIARAGWTRGKDGSVYAVLPVQSAGADGISVAVQTIQPGDDIPAQARIQFADRYGKVLEEVPLRDLNTMAGPRHSVIASGDSMYLVLKVPADATAFKVPALRVSQIKHNPTSGRNGSPSDEVLAGIATPHAAIDRVSGDAGVGVAAECAKQVGEEEHSKAYIDAMNASAKITSWNKDGFGVQCSGTVVKSLDGFALFTAQHCVDDQQQADTLVYEYNFRKNTCGGTIVRNDHIQVSGGSVILSDLGTKREWTSGGDALLLKVVPEVPISARNISFGVLPVGDSGGGKDGPRFLALSYPYGEALEVVDLPDYETYQDTGSNLRTILFKSAASGEGGEGPNSRGWVGRFAPGSSGSGIFSYRNGRYELVAEPYLGLVYPSGIQLEWASGIHKPESLEIVEAAMNEPKNLHHQTKINTLSLKVNSVDDVLRVHQDGRLIKDIYEPEVLQLMAPTPASTTRIKLDLSNVGCWAWGVNAELIVNGNSLGANKSSGFGANYHCGWVWNSAHTITSLGKRYAFESRSHDAGDTTHMCLDDFRPAAGTYPCHSGHNQQWFLSGAVGSFVHLCTQENRCIVVNQDNSSTTTTLFEDAVAAGDRAMWAFDKMGRIYSKSSMSKCLTSKPWRYVTLDTCRNDPIQQWQALEVAAEQYDVIGYEETVTQPPIAHP